MVYLIYYFREDITFSRGYGEENDFCMRALNKGWKNIIDDSTYIYHKRSTSFIDSKEQLIKDNRTKLDKLHPDYKDKIKVFRQDDNLIKIREKIEKSMSEFSTNYKSYSLSKNILYVLHEGGGGTPNTNKDLMSIVSQNDYTTYLLTSNGQTLKLSVYEEKQIHQLMQWKLSSTWDINVLRIRGDTEIFILMYSII